MADDMAVFGIPAGTEGRKNQKRVLDLNKGIVEVIIKIFKRTDLGFTAIQGL